MTKTIKKSDLEKLAAEIDQLPAKKADELKQKEAISELALQFSEMLRKGYTIEDAYERFNRMEGADLKLQTFRTYLKDSVPRTRKKQPTDKSPKTEARATLVAKATRPSDGQANDPATASMSHVDDSTTASTSIVAETSDAASMVGDGNLRNNTEPREAPVATQKLFDQVGPDDRLHINR